MTRGRSYPSRTEATLVVNTFVLEANRNDERWLSRFVGDELLRAREFVESRLRDVPTKTIRRALVAILAVYLGREHAVSPKVLQIREKSNLVPNRRRCRQFGTRQTRGCTGLRFVTSNWKSERTRCSTSAHRKTTGGHLRSTVRWPLDAAGRSGSAVELSAGTPLAL